MKLIYRERYMGQQGAGGCVRLDIGDHSLVQGCLKGWEESYRLLLARHEGYIYSLCYRLAGHGEEVLNMVQEAI